MRQKFLYTLKWKVGEDSGLRTQIKDVSFLSVPLVLSLSSATIPHAPPTLSVQHFQRKAQEDSFLPETHLNLRKSNSTSCFTQFLSPSSCQCSNFPCHWSNSRSWPGEPPCRKPESSEFIWQVRGCQPTPHLLILPRSQEINGHHPHQ